MDFRTWVESEPGRASLLADYFGLTRASITGWKNFGVPPSRMKAVRDLSGGAVTLEEMLPDSPAHPDLSAPKTEPATAAAAA